MTKAREVIDLTAKAKEVGFCDKTDSFVDRRNELIDGIERHLGILRAYHLVLLHQAEKISFPSEREEEKTAKLRLREVDTNMEAPAMDDSLISNADSILEEGKQSLTELANAVEELTQHRRDLTDALERLGEGIDMPEILTDGVGITELLDEDEGCESDDDILLEKVMMNRRKPRRKVKGTPHGTGSKP